jgi:segregation and condensation protein B
MEVGRASTIGRPALFGTTPDFLQQFGLGSLDALPKPETPELEALEARLAASAERIRQAVGTDEEPAGGSATADTAEATEAVPE